jgi:hypothetical protein
MMGCPISVSGSRLPHGIADRLRLCKLGASYDNVTESNEADNLWLVVQNDSVPMAPQRGSRRDGNTLPKWLVGSFVGDVGILGLGSPVYTAFLYVEIMGTWGVEKQVLPGQNEKGQNHAK